MDSIYHTSGESSRQPPALPFEEWCKQAVNPSPLEYFDHLVGVHVDHMTAWKRQQEKSHE